MSGASVVIINHKSQEYLKPCLQSLFQRTRLPLEVVLIENHGFFLREIAACFPQVKIVQNRRAQGFAANVNTGIALSCGETILLLNPDTVLQNDVPGILHNYLKEHQHVAVAGPKILNGDGSLQPSCRSFPTFAAALGRHTILGKTPPFSSAVRRYLLLEQAREKPMSVDWVSGACMALSRKAVEDIGFFDERFTMYLEDADFCYRARCKGWEVAYVPKAVLVHFSHGSTEKNPYRNIIRHHLSMVRYVAKHRMVSPALWPLVWTAAIARCLYAISTRGYARFKS